MASLVDVLKEISTKSVGEGMPMQVRYGIVKGVNPLKIEVEQKLLLEAEHDHLILTHLVRDYYVDMSVSHVTEKRAGGGGDAEFESHDHDYKGRKKMRIHNGLVKGEKVMLLQIQGGQQFIVLDRVDDPIVKGQIGRAHV